MGHGYGSSGDIGGIIGSLIPLLIIGIIWAIFLSFLAKRKGRNRLGWFLAGFVPLFNVIGAFYLVSLPDEAIINQLNAIVKKMQQYDFVPKNKGTSTPIEENWTCTCGQVNSMAITNCPVCGLKRDYLLKKNT